MGSCHFKILRGLMFSALGSMVRAYIKVSELEKAKVKTFSIACQDLRSKFFHPTFSCLLDISYGSQKPALFHITRSLVSKSLINVLDINFYLESGSRTRDLKWGINQTKFRVGICLGFRDM